MNREGELVPANRDGTSATAPTSFAYGLGSVIVAYGVMIAPTPLAARGSRPWAASWSS